MKPWLLLLVLFVLAVPLQAHAATVTVDLNKAQFAWTASVVDATHGAATSYNVKCGLATGVYTMTFSVLAPAVSTSVSSVVPTPGTYFCVVTGVDSFGESTPSNEVNFQSGYSPSVPSSLTVK